MRVELESVKQWNDNANSGIETTRGSIEVNAGCITLCQIVVKGPQGGIRHIVNMSRSEVLTFAKQIIEALED
jgi:hypothetical protein